MLALSLSLSLSRARAEPSATSPRRVSPSRASWGSSATTLTRCRRSSPPSPSKTTRCASRCAPPCRNARAALPQRPRRPDARRCHAQLHAPASRRCHTRPPHSTRLTPPASLRLALTRAQVRAVRMGEGIETAMEALRESDSRELSALSKQ
eukprot:4768409-Prymnesium_polylepis.1